MPFSRPMPLFLKPPKGVLLWGPPGTGKTRLVQGLVGTARGQGVASFAPTLADLLRAEIGGSEAQLRGVLAAAHAAQPAILFFDELDAVFPERAGAGGGPDLVGVLAGVLDTWAAEAEGVRVLLVGATNWPGRVSHRLLVADRFDLQIAVPLPDRAARLAILRGVAGPGVAEHVLQQLADALAGQSAAEVARAVVPRAG